MVEIMLLADALSWVNESLNAQEVKAILDEMTVGCSNQAELRILTGQWGKEEEWVWVSACPCSKGRNACNQLA